MSGEGEQKAADGSGGIGGGGVEEVPDPELDSLLDDALQDFVQPKVPNPTQASTAPASAPLGTDLASLVTAAGITAAVGGPGGQEGQAKQGEMWTEEFVQQATAQFEQTMRLLMQQQQQQQEGKENPVVAATATTTQASSSPAQSSAEAPEVDLSSMAAQFAQFAQMATKSAEEAKSDADFTQCLADTLKQIGDNTEQLQNPPSADDLTKMFENMGLGGGEAAGGEGGLGALFPLMQAMLENVLSKEVLYSPMKDITDKYPDWLADNRANLPEEDFTRYSKQYDIMKQVVDLYEEETEGDSEEVRGQRFEKIMLSMQKLQELGQPPKDLVGDMGPVMSFDPSGNPVLPDLSSVLGAAGVVPGAGGDGSAPPGEGQQGEECCVM
uniref:Peroxin-19 n=1 Tax=Scylla olivacea TaxID=85551 RepID=A0A0P4WRK6_SCYOL